MKAARKRPEIESPSYYACNTCNAVRQPTVHPCPRCRCPEYRIEAGPTPDVPESPKAAPEVVFRGDELAIHFDRFDLPSYDLFLRAKALPEYKVTFDDRDETYTITAPARFAAMLGVERPDSENGDLPLSDFLLDDQRFIVPLALDAKRFAVWSTCGLGKTVIAFEWARQVVHRTGGRVLIVTMNDIVEVFLAERDKFYPDLPVTRIESQAELVRWCEGGEPGIAITNYEKFNPKGLTDGTINECRYLKGIILDESSRLKGGGDSVQKKVLNASCKGIEYKLSCTATPAPNQTIEFVSQAVFLETVRSENDIIWSHFVRDNKTHRRTVKPNARDGFFKFMATWSIYLKHPKRFGWRLDQPDVPEPTYFNHDLESTPEQRALARDVLSDAMGGNLIVSRETNAIERVKLAEIARGFIYRGKGRDREIVRVPSAKPPFIADLANREVADGHQVLIWTVFDEEAALIREGLASSSVEVLTGKTKTAERKVILDRYRAGETQILVSRPSMLGYGQNFQFCTSMIFSGFNDSFEELFQAICRAVRYAQSQSVRVHFPIVRDLEEETFANLQRKASDYERDTSEMEDNYVRAIMALRGVA